MTARPRRRYSPGHCDDCGRRRNVTRIYWWTTGAPYTVCAECIRPYRPVILAPCSPECVHNQPQEATP